jgi:hypothetical protein
MILAGLWHGAAWTFVIWGAYHGVLLLLTMLWRTLRGSARPSAAGRLLGWAFTITAFAASAVFFRASDIQGSWHLLQAMAGLGDQTLLLGHSKFDDWMIGHGYISDALASAWCGTTWSIAGTLMTVAAPALALFVPDTMDRDTGKEVQIPLAPADRVSGRRLRRSGRRWSLRCSSSSSSISPVSSSCTTSSGDVMQVRSYVFT